MSKRIAEGVGGSQSRVKKQKLQADERCVTEWELWKLSESVPPSHYIKVGLSLGIRQVFLQKELKCQLGDTTNALNSVFMKWKSQQKSQQGSSVNEREVLAKCLRQCELVELADELGSGHLHEHHVGQPPKPLDSQIEPLSPVLVKRCRNEFMSYYRSNWCMIRSDPLDPDSYEELTNLYTNPVLEMKKQRGRVEERKLTYDELKKLIGNKNIHRRLLVQAEAGAGKTTLCGKFVSDWIKRKSFKKFEWVLIVRLFDCLRYSIGQIAKSYLTKSNPTTVSQLNHYMRSNPGKVFIAADGLDELSVSVEEIKEHVSKECQQSQPSTSHSLSRGDNSGVSDNPDQCDGINIGDIICSKELEMSPVLVTSRPWRAKEIRSDGDLSRLYTFIHLEGFSQDGLSEYIHKYFPENPVMASRLIELLGKNNVVSKNIVRYPIFVAMFCLMWKEIGEQECEKFPSFQTFSQVLGKTFSFLKEHHAQKTIKNVSSPELKSYLKKINNLIEPVNSVVCSGLLNDVQVFFEHDFQHCPESLEIACRVGILSQENRRKSMLDCEDNLPHIQSGVFFPHNLFKEYMAAMSIVSMYRLEPSAFDNLMREKILPSGEKFRYLLYFSASLDKEVGKTIVEYMVQMLGERSDLLVDVAFESNNRDAVAAMHARYPPEDQSIDIDLSTTSHTIAAYRTIVKDAASMEIFRMCNLDDSRNLAEIIYSAPSLKTLSIEGHFHDIFWNILQEHGADIQVRRLEVDWTLSSLSSTPKKVAEALSLMPYLEDLIVSKLHAPQLLFSEMHRIASSVEDAFPQVSSGNFTINGNRLRDMESFLQYLDADEDLEFNMSPLYRALADWSSESEDKQQAD